MIEISFVRSLPDTKLAKYIPQQIIRRDLACNFTEMVQSAANIDREKVARDAVIQSDQD